MEYWVHGFMGSRRFPSLRCAPQPRQGVGGAGCPRRTQFSKQPLGGREEKTGAVEVVLRFGDFTLSQRSGFVRGAFLRRLLPRKA